ncbi:MAG: hypothetical protein WB239_16450 [Acidimicrobiia bacterium]
MAKDAPSAQADAETQHTGSIVAAIVFHAITNLAADVDPNPWSRLVALLTGLAAAVGLVIY